MFKVLLTAALMALTIADPIGRFDGKIIGGKEISIEDAPYQITLLHKGHHNCGGSIVSEKYVLTAAHCVDNRPEEKDKYTVRAGSSNYTTNGTLHHVVKFITRKEDEPADIALIEVYPHFTFDNTRAPIPLFSVREEIAPKSIAFVTGWGRTAANIISTALQGVQVPMISKEECYEAYKKDGGISEGEICAAHPEGGKDACQGDSGGPLTIHGRLAGIVSWGIGCAEKEYPGVYVEVAHYAEWIKENTDL